MATHRSFASLGTRFIAILALSACGLPALAQGQPGCPPSFCPPVGADNPDGIARLTLFPGTNSVVTDNGPGDLADQTCGVIVVNDISFPGAPYSSGTALFSGRIEMEPANSASAFAGELRVTNAVISNPVPAAGGGVNFATTSPLPLACGEFFWDQGGLPSVLHVKIEGTVESEDDGSGSVPNLVGTEELHVTARALSFTMVSPVFSIPPSELGVSVFGPPGGTPSPHPVLASATGTGTYADGPGIIGLLLGGELPPGEMFRLPTSIEAAFGDVPPPNVPSGGGTTTPLVVHKVDPFGGSLMLSWDTESCEGAGTGHSLLYGYGSQLPNGFGTSFQLGGAVCGLGPEPTFMWENVPESPVDPMLWWLVVSHGDSENEGSWGVDSSGDERMGPGPAGSSDECGMTTKALGNACEP